MKQCSFCNKPTTRFATSARNAREMDIHCRRLWCRFTHWLAVWWRNVYGRKHPKKVEENA